MSNESGEAQKHSQTKAAKVYELTSLNGVDVTVLDTPGLADTRGLQKDNEHKKSIATAIQENIPEVTAVIILANGTNPRLGVATDYAITTLCSIFPKTLAQNIGILFTHVSSPLSWNFEVDTLPVELQGATEFLIDNPLAMQKRYLKDRAKAEAGGKIDEKKMKKFEKCINGNHQTAVETLAEIFDWLDGLEPQTTKEITSLYNQSVEIERNISNTLARMTQLAQAVNVLENLVKDSSGTELVSHSKSPDSRGLTCLCRLILEQLISSGSFKGEFGFSRTVIRATLPADFHFATPTATGNARVALAWDVGN